MQFLKRYLLNNLKEWQLDQHKKPLIIRGARQVGKTALIEEFGSKFYTNCVSVNLEKDTAIADYFNLATSVQEIIKRIELVKNQPINPHTTLLFLDEIQAIPRAIQMLRYFYEETPAVHVIAAGSLLEFALDQDFPSFPVGRVEMRYLYPFSFAEFLEAQELTLLIEHMHNINPTESLDAGVYNQYRDLLKQYFQLGGMPEVIARYLDTDSFLSAERIKSSLLQNFIDDFGKYGRKTNVHNLEIVFREIVSRIGQRIQFTQLGLPKEESRKAWTATNLLEKAMLIKRVDCLKYATFPLIPKRKTAPKMLFLDIGLAQYMNKISTEIMQSDNLSTIYKGGLAEQFVGQSLLAQLGSLENPELFYWQRKKENVYTESEIDYVYPYKSMLIPIEVKFSKGSSLKALHHYVAENKPPLAVRIYDGPLIYETISVMLVPGDQKIAYQLLSLPLFLVDQLPRMLDTLIKKI